MKYITDFLLEHVKKEKIPQFAYKHGLAAVVYEEIKRIYKETGIMSLGNKEIISLDAYSDNIASGYEKQVEAIRSLAEFYKSNNIKLCVFKGYSMSLLYDNPKSRVGCDVDIFLFGDGQRADELVSQKGIPVEIESEDRHSVFNWDNVHFENHASFINLRILRNLIFFEQFLEKEIQDSSIADTNIENVYLPSDNFNALYISFHLASHWISSEVTLRHLYDWCMFIKNRGKEVDWDRIYDIAKKIGFARFLSSLNEITIRSFDLDESVAPTKGADSDLANQILFAATHPYNEMQISSNTNFLKACFLKTIRFFKRQEKRSAVYHQNVFVTFYNIAISYLRQFTHFDNRSIWETSHIKNSKLS